MLGPAPAPHACASACVQPGARLLPPAGEARAQALQAADHQQVRGARQPARERVVRLGRPRRLQKQRTRWAGVACCALLSQCSRLCRCRGSSAVKCRYLRGSTGPVGRPWVCVAACRRGGRLVVSAALVSSSTLAGEPQLGMPAGVAC